MARKKAKIEWTPWIILGLVVLAGLSGYLIQERDSRQIATEELSRIYEGPELPPEEPIEEPVPSLPPTAPVQELPYPAKGLLVNEGVQLTRQKIAHWDIPTAGTYEVYVFMDRFVIPITFKTKADFERGQRRQMPVNYVKECTVSKNEQRGLKNGGTWIKTCHLNGGEVFGVINEGLTSALVRVKIEKVA